MAQSIRLECKRCLNMSHNDFVNAIWYWTIIRPYKATWQTESWAYIRCVNGLCSGVSRCSWQKDDEPSSKCNLACVAGLMFWYAVVCSLKSGEQKSLDWRLYYFLSLQASKDTQICQLHRIMEFSKLSEHVS